MTFNDLGISSDLQKTLEAQNITSPTDIQAKACPVLLEGHSAWLTSATGSGKTLAYVLPPLSKVDPSSLDLQLAILAPTHELVAQIIEVIRKLSEGMPQKIRIQSLMGNSPVQRQKDKLKLKPHIVVGSLGRMLELIKEKKLKMHACRWIVIDEADRLLIEKSIPEVQNFVAAAPQDAQLVFVSASEQNNALATAKSFRPDLVHIEAEIQALDENIDHYYIKSEHRHKGDALRQLLHALKPEKALVFMHRNEDVDRLFAILDSKDLNLVALHGQCDKSDRQKALQQFRKGEVQVLLASDVAARGLDIKGVDCVINCDLPSQPHDYLHRVGRTGRAGERGISISIVAPNEMPIIKKYQQELSIELQRGNLAKGKFSLEEY
jgi:ATP-dependent RNA helicase DeaD